MSLHVQPIRLPLRIEPGMDVMGMLVRAVSRRSVRQAIVVVSSKLVAYDQGRLTRLADVRPTVAGRRLARRFGLSPAFGTLIRSDASHVYGGVRGAVLTDVQGRFTVNAGIDASNVPAGMVVRWPHAPWTWAAALHRRLTRSHGRPLGILIADSHCVPGRLGTTAVALAIAGFHGMVDVRGQRDLYGRRLRLTRINIADDLASSAHVLQGEGNERTPLAIIRGAPIRFTTAPSLALTRALSMSPHQDLYQPLHAKRIR